MAIYSVSRGMCSGCPIMELCLRGFSFCSNRFISWQGGPLDPGVCNSYIIGRQCEAYLVMLPQIYEQLDHLQVLALYPSFRSSNTLNTTSCWAWLYQLQKSQCIPAPTTPKAAAAAATKPTTPALPASSTASDSKAAQTALRPPHLPPPLPQPHHHHPPTPP